MPYVKAPSGVTLPFCCMPTKKMEFYLKFKACLHQHVGGSLWFHVFIKHSLWNFPLLKVPGYNIVVQLSEKKPAAGFLLREKLPQFKLNFKSVNSFHQANTWRPAAAEPCQWVQSAGGQDPVGVWLRGRGLHLVWLPCDRCPLIHKLPLLWQASWNDLWHLSWATASMTPHHSFPNVSFCTHCVCSPQAATFSRLDRITTKTPSLPLHMPTLHSGVSTKQVADPDMAAPISVYYLKPQLEWKLHKPGSLYLLFMVSLALGTMLGNVRQLL